MFRSIVMGAAAFICFVLMLPQELNARGGGSQGGHNGVTISKSTDKSSPKMMGNTTSSTRATAQASKKKGQTSKSKGAIEIQDYGFGVSMPTTTSR